MMSIEVQGTGENAIFHDFDNVVHHRARRAIEEFETDNVTYSCDTKDHPQPTAEYPAVLFEDFNYNNCTLSGKFLRIRSGDFHKWGRTAPFPQRGRILTWKSMLIYPGTNVTFRTCCPSGNEFMKTVGNWNSTANLNLTVFRNDQLTGNDGVWYEYWLHWLMNFYLRVETPQDFSSIPDCGICYFGSCGVTGKCECASGYSGTTCNIRPSVNGTYPSQDKPLILFKEENFQGEYITGHPEEFKAFASNSHSSRVVDYNSMRVLYNRTVVFSRNILFESYWNVGSDIYNLEDFMLANTEIANPLWYNYDESIDLTFYAKVVGNPSCDNCSVTQGVCYTGSCVCMTGYTGDNCDVPV